MIFCSFAVKRIPLTCGKVTGNGTLYSKAQVSEKWTWVSTCIHHCWAHVIVGCVADGDVYANKIDSYHKLYTQTRGRMWGMYLCSLTGRGHYIWHLNKQKIDLPPIYMRINVKGGWQTEITDLLCSILISHS